MQIQKGFVSEVDQFLQEFDKKHPEWSQSQKDEKKKYQRIYRLREVIERSTESTDDLFS